MRHTNTSVKSNLAAAYLQSFYSVEEKDAVDPHRCAKAAFSTEIHLTAKEERAIVLNEIFIKSKRYQEVYQDMGKVLNKYAWKDLHLFCGTTTNQGYHLLGRMNKTITTLGEGVLASLMATPITDLEELSKRQQLIALFCQETALSHKLKNHLQHYKEAEKEMLSLWSATDPLYTKEYSTYVNSLFYTHYASFNRLAYLLQLRKVLVRDCRDIYVNYIFWPLFAMMAGECTIVFSSLFNHFQLFSYFHFQFYKNLFPLSLPIWNFFQVEKIYQFLLQRGYALSPLKVCRIGGHVCAALVTLHAFWRSYKGYRTYKTYKSVLQNLALRMADIQTFLMVIKNINALVVHTPQLEALYGQKLSSIRTLLRSAQASSEVGKLLRYVTTLPFRSWSYISHNAGKLLATYKLFVEHKAIFHDAMYELGQLDTLLSVATLMQETVAVGSPHAYTFTKFLSSHTQPCLIVKGLWNPMLTPTTAIGNNVSMGADTQTIILTGPNAGGKSSFLTGVTYAVLLSQTLGIAPAHSFEVTPFHNINTYIDITDDIAAGKSLFMVEVMRFQDYLNKLTQLKEHEFSFSIFDEPFSGTNPAEGAAASYSVLNTIAAYKNAFNIVATHYPMLMLLEKDEPTKGFKNYKVFVTKNKDGRIEYGYTVIPGISTQTIAIDILEEQGYAFEMLKQARAILDNPERYNKRFIDF